MQSYIVSTFCCRNGYSRGVRARSQIPVYGLTGRGLGSRLAMPGAGFCGQNLGIKYIPCVCISGTSVEDRCMECTVDC